MTRRMLGLAFRARSDDIRAGERRKARDASAENRTLSAPLRARLGAAGSGR